MEGNQSNFHSSSDFSLIMRFMTETQSESELNALMDSEKEAQEIATEVFQSNDLNPASRRSTYRSLASRSILSKSTEKELNRSVAEEREFRKTDTIDLSKATKGEYNCLSGRFEKGNDSDEDESTTNNYEVLTELDGGILQVFNDESDHYETLEEAIANGETIETRENNSNSIKKAKTVQEKEPTLSESQEHVRLVQRIMEHTLKGSNFEKFCENRFSKSGENPMMWDSMSEEVVVATKKLTNQGANKVMHEAVAYNPLTGQIRPNKIFAIAAGDKKEDLRHEQVVVEYLRDKLEAKCFANCFVAPDKFTISEKKGGMVGNLAGRNLDRMIKTTSFQQKLSLSRKLGNILIALREAGVVHRDIKPDNILELLGADGKPRIGEDGCVEIGMIDFGNTLILEPLAGQNVMHFRLEYLDPKFLTNRRFQMLINERATLNLEIGSPLNTDPYMYGLTLINIFSEQTTGEFVNYARTESEKYRGSARSTKLSNWKRDVDNWTIWGKIDSKLKSQNIDHQVISAVINRLKSLVNPDPMLRPFLEDTNEFFDKVLKELN